MNDRFEIIGTFSKMCDDKEIMVDLISSGMTGFRFSFSKDTPEYHFKKAHELMDISNELRKDLRLIMDLPGIKPRVSNQKYIDINRDEIHQFVPRPDMEGLYITHYAFLSGIKPGDVIITGDGEVAFRVLDVNDGGFSAKALLSGTLTHNRGITIEGRKNIERHLTEDEMNYLQLNYEKGIVFNEIYYSFADSLRSIEEVSEFCRGIDDDYKPTIIPKIETISGVDNLADTINGCNEILIGRGDLAIQGGMMNFYDLQQRAVSICKKNGKKLIIGTQLFEKVTREWMPYRAEISDLSHLLTLGMDGILLEADTIVGNNRARGMMAIDELVKRYKNNGG